MYSKNQNWNKRMTMQEYRKSGFFESLQNLDTVSDINSTRDVFSYQHFYVIYCKFWEIDVDHDMAVNLQALQRYDCGAMTHAILKRVIEGAGKLPTLGIKSGLMSYEDFVWFISSVEDKRTPQAIEYWFRCLDIDGDGCISLYELREFYDDQYERMMHHRMADLWKFSDFVCALYDCF
jgi:Ca2+-binding EF-hand superfamily protein